ncbi:hypothetical protein [Streptomyces sp. NPDC055632]
MSLPGVAEARTAGLTVRSLIAVEGPAELLGDADSRTSSTPGFRNAPSRFRDSVWARSSASGRQTVTTVT